MTASVKTSGSQTATLDTEHTLATVTDAGVYQVSIDLAAMVAGDITIVTFYGKARSSDTERVQAVWTFSGAQSPPLPIFPPLISPHSFKVTLQQTDGTGRAYPWAVYVT